MIAFAPISMPMNISSHVSSRSGEPLEDPTTYRILIGRLIYLTNRRPNITHVLHHLSQFVATPNIIHPQISIWILCYLKQALGQRISLLLIVK